MAAELIVTVPNDPKNQDLYSAGRNAAEHLQNPMKAAGDLRVVHKAELVTYLKRHHVTGAGVVSQLPLAYHLVEVLDGDLFGAVARIARWHNDPSGSKGAHGYVEHVEENRGLLPAAPTVDIGSGFVFGAQHDAYLTMLGLDPTARPVTNDGDGVRVAIVDSGIEPGVSVNRRGFKDVIDASSTGPLDNSGHGTAMAMIVHSVAPKAEIHVIRAFDKTYALLFDVIAGIGAAVDEAKADIINCSLGFSGLGTRCSRCGGSGGGRSKTFETFLEKLTNTISKVSPPIPQPIIAAAVGNDYSPTAPAAFREPAKYDSTLAVGAITSGYNLSPFSNRGTAKNLYLLQPGGDDTVTPIEAVGTDSSGTNYCLGTSPAAAYATGLLALYRGESKYNALSVDDFLDAMAARCNIGAIPGHSLLNHGKGFFYYH